MATNNDNKQLAKQVAGIFGGVVIALAVGFVFGTVVSIIWDLVNIIL
jgi:hypothetical protein